MKKLNALSISSIDFNLLLKIIFWLSLTIALILFPLFTRAQLTLVKDINISPTVTDPNYQGLNGSYPGGFINILGITYFSAKGPEGSELWRTDGTSGGTSLVKDIRQGPASSQPNAFFNFNGTLLFIANDGIYGSELWKSDGTEQGTVLVQDINPGNSDGITYCYYCGGLPFTVFNNKVYFSGNDGVKGQEPWETDGTEAGTKLVKDIYPGPNGSNAAWFTQLGSKLYFSANTASFGTELWTTDGTIAGTSLVKDLLPGSGSSNPYSLVVANELIFFSASGDNVTYDNELYKSDGTEAGTQLVKNINPTSSSQPNTLTFYNGQLYFFCNDGVVGNELWKSDGTGAGTVLVKDIEAGTGGSGPQGTAVSFNGNLYFALYTLTYGAELWKSDGTSGGTLLVKDINPGSVHASVAGLANANGTLYFSATSGSTGSELWKSDGTEAGTVLIKDIYPGSQYYGPNSSYPNGFIYTNGTVIFSAGDEIVGQELFKTDGTSAGTVVVKNIFSPNKQSLSGHNVRVGSNVFFSADDGINGNELWKTDGTTIGTTMVKDLSPGPSSSYFNYFTNVNGVLFFQANGALYKSDGTDGGTVLLKSGYFSYDMIEVANTLYFNYYDNSNGHELWKSDGSFAGTARVKDIDPVGQQSAAQNFTNVNGTLFFIANDGINGTELWKSDGTEAGTVIVKAIVPSTTDDYSFRLYASGTNLYFWVNDGVNGQELWKSDGTSAGTILLKDIYPGSGGSFVSHQTATLNGKFYFTANSPAYGAELWETNGTLAGTVLVKDVIPGNFGSTPVNFMLLGNTFLFTAYTDASYYNTSLWKSDGTAGGTQLVTDLPYNSSIQLIKTGVSMVYFIEYTNKLTWRTDGTAEGTFPISMLQSSPLSIIGTDELLLNADDGITGGELWKYTPQAIVPEIKVLRSYQEFPTASSYDFGSAEVGTSLKGVGIAISNTGTGSLLVPTISISGTNSGDFIITQTNTAKKVDPGMVTTFSVRFLPTALGNRTATINIQSNDADENPFQINLQGEGTPLSQTISFAALATKTYGDAAFELTGSVSSNLTVTYTSSNTNVATISGSTVTIIDAGTTAITASQSGNGTYTAASPVDQPLTVNKTTLTVKADDANKIYGEANPEFTISYTGFVNGEVVSVIDNPPVASSVANATSDVGQYDIEVAAGTDNSYLIVPAITKGKLTISKANLTAKADDVSRLYGETNPEFEISYTGFVNGDVYSVIDLPPTTSTIATVNSNVDQYDIELIGGEDNNYLVIADINIGKLTINPATLVAKANDNSKTYGEINPALTINYSGFINGDDDADLDVPPTITTSAAQASNAGQYDIDVTGGTGHNYTLVSDATKGKLTINKATLAAKADDKSKTYGEANPAFTISYSGFVNGDGEMDIDTAPSVNTIATTSSTAGQYDINVAEGIDNNYIITADATKGKLTINKATLTAKADDKSKTYGEVNPPFTISYTGFVNGDDALDIDNPPSINTIATTSSVAGQYDINVAGGIDNNYIITADATKGKLTISKASQSISFTLLTDKLLSDPVFSLTATSTSGLSVQFTSTSDKITLSGNQLTLVKPGRVTIKADQSGNTSYLAAPSVENSFCINPLSPTISVNTTNLASPNLTSGNDTGNQWFLNGAVIPGATGKTHTVSAGGSYQVQTTIDNCVSPLSVAKVFLVTGDVMKTAIAERATIYPNPVENKLVVRLDGFDPNRYVNINLIDGMGRRVTEVMELGEKEISMEVGHYASGVYFIQMIQGNEAQQLRFIKK